MSEFNIALQKTLVHEGGYVDDPDDPGDETYKGVARAMHSKWTGWELVDRHKNRPGFPATLDKDAQLQEEIVRFYQMNFWDALSGDRIENQTVADSVFDFAVNSGLHTAVALVQMVVGADVDGVLGSETLAKLNAFDPGYFLAAFTVGKIARYMAIIKNRPTSKKYLYGWVSRALS